MKIIINNIIPFKSFLAINLFGILFVREEEYKKVVINNYDYFYKDVVNHEKIHTAQMKELLYIFFYLWYIIEWLIKSICYMNFNKAYKNISFEREAYINQEYIHYLDYRKHYNWIRFIF